MKELKLEFFLKTSPAVLFSRISTPSGLAEWFADNVKVDGKTFTFVWGKSEQEAEIRLMVPNEYICFRWLDSEFGTEFEFSIEQDELTNDVALVVTDRVAEDDIEDTKTLWSSQIAKLKHVIGS